MEAELGGQEAKNEILADELTMRTFLARVGRNCANLARNELPDGILVGDRGCDSRPSQERGGWQ